MQIDGTTLKYYQFFKEAFSKMTPVATTKKQAIVLTDSQNIMRIRGHVTQKRTETLQVRLHLKV